MAEHELLRKHAADYLAQYLGNIQQLLRAIESGDVPDGEDAAIQQLRQHMADDRTSADDPLILRFALAVPGLMRGIRPPVSVLAPARGGFSQSRLAEAAGTAARLGEALRLGRYFLGPLSPDTVTAFRELSERIHASASGNVDWVAVYAGLSGAEAETLAGRAIEYLDSPEKCEKEIGVKILQCLADFRPEGLGDSIGELLRRDMLRPSSLYRNCPDPIAAALAGKIKEAQGLRLNHLLLAFAWSRGEPARDAFSRWRQSPPPWSAGLHVPAEDYLQEAGWTLDSNGRPKELISQSCHRIVPDRGTAVSALTIPCRSGIAERCPACGGSLAWLFDFSNLPDRYFLGDRVTAPRRILFCPYDACFYPVFSRYRDDGSSEWHPATKSDETSSSGGRISCVRELVASPQPPFAAADAFGIGDATALGGVPMWIQDAEYHRCPDCRNLMSFLAQFDNSSMPEPEEGIYYAFFCGPCRIAAVNYQQT